MCDKESHKYPSSGRRPLQSGKGSIRVCLEYPKLSTCPAATHSGALEQGTMDISTKPLFRKPNILRALHSEHTTVILYSDNGVNCLSAFQPPKTPSPSDGLPKLYPTNRTLDGHPLSTFVHLSPNGRILFASLQDDQRLAVTTVAGLSASPVETVRYLDLQFKTPLFSLQNLGTRANSTIVAISSQGELTLVHCDPNLVLQTRTHEKLNLQRVLSTHTFGNEHLIVFGIQSDRFVFIALRISVSTDISSLRITTFNPVPLPIPDSVRLALFSKSSKHVSLSACFYSNCVYAIWSNGTVNVLAPGDASGRKLSMKEQDSIDLWCTPLSDKNHKPNPPVCIQSFNLIRGSSGHQNDPNLPVFITRAGVNFVAVCRGTTVSIWDVIYHVPHGYVELDQPIREMSLDSDRILLVSGDAILVLEIPEAKSSRSPTLANAIRRKTSCDPVISNLRAVVDNEPLRAHALTTTPISAAAHAGGQSPHLFSRALDAERERELRDVKAVLSRPDTPTSAALRKLGSDYFEAAKDDVSSLEVPRLPSDRLAAAFVARCLYEIAFSDDCNYVVPLIDMIGTGVVSAEGVIVALEMSSSWAPADIGTEATFSSLSDLFVRIGKFTNVLEAVVARVIDLPELDVIGVLHIAAWSRKDLRRKIEEAANRSKTDTRRLKLDYARAGQLLESCLKVRTGQRLIVQVISKISFSDSLLLLHELNEFMRQEEIDDDIRNELKARAGMAEQRANTGETFAPEDAVNYRGYKRWVDTSGESEAKTWGNGAFKGCVEWIGYILDAHLTSVILDGEGALLASQLLETVQKERERRECLQGLKGMAVQIQSQIDSPERRDSNMYRVVTRNIPAAHNVI